VLPPGLQDEMAKLAELEGTSSSSGNAKAKLNNVLMQMRKNCNHPDLITSAFTADLDYPPPEVRRTTACCHARCYMHSTARCGGSLPFSIITLYADS
jgi:SNF2 family DNA or RNA helicase